MSIDPGSRSESSSNQKVAGFNPWNPSAASQSILDTEPQIAPGEQGGPS